MSTAPSIALTESECAPKHPDRRLIDAYNETYGDAARFGFPPESAHELAESARRLEAQRIEKGRAR